MLELRWAVVLVVCALLFGVGLVGTFRPSLGYEVPFIWQLGAVIGAWIGLAGLTGFGVWQIILSCHAMKATDEAMKARGGKTVAGYIQSLGEETLKRIQANGEETIERIKRNGEETLLAIQRGK